MPRSRDFEHDVAAVCESCEMLHVNSPRHVRKNPRCGECAGRLRKLDGDLRTILVEGGYIEPLPPNTLARACACGRLWVTRAAYDAHLASGNCR